MALTDCTVSGNIAVKGGGLYNYNVLDLVACTISGNSASKGGGGLYNFPYPGYASRRPRATRSSPANVPRGRQRHRREPTPCSSIGSYNLIGTGGSGGLVNGSTATSSASPTPGSPRSATTAERRDHAAAARQPGHRAGSNALAVDPNGSPWPIDQRELPGSSTA